MKIKPGRPLKLLVWDIENKPGTYGPGDYTHGKLTALAGQFVDEKRPESWILQRDDVRQMRGCARGFRAKWDAADIVIGHNIRRHDIGLTNGWLTTISEPLLAPKSIVDTYLDQPKMSGMSRSLENLCARWGCPLEKVHMPEHAWEGAYDGVPAMVNLMRQRVETDVAINLWLYGELRKRGLLP